VGEGRHPWAKKAMRLLSIDDAHDFLSTQEREQTEWVVKKNAEPYHTVKGMIDAKLTEGLKRIQKACKKKTEKKEDTI